MTVDFKAALEAFPGSFLLLKPNAPYFTILAISDELLRLTRMERQNAEGRSVLEVYPDNPEAAFSTDQARLKASLHNAVTHMQQDKLPTIRYDVRNVEGTFEERYWSVTSKPVLNKAGECFYIIVTANDITAQIKAEKAEDALRNIEKKYNLFMQTPVAVCMVSGPDRIVELANTEMHKLWETSVDILGKPFLEAIPEARDQGLTKSMDLVRKNREPLSVWEFPIRIFKNGKKETAFYNIVYHPYEESKEDKGPAGVICVLQDVTEQVQVNKKSRDHELQVHSILESSPYPIGVYIGKEMHIQFANQTLKDALGKGNDIIGRSYKEVMPELESQGIFEHLRKVYNTGIPFHAKNHRLNLRINGNLQPFYFNFSFTPLYNSAGEVYGIVNSGADVTDLALAHQKIEESARSLNNLANAMPQIVWMADEQGKVTYYNERVSKFEGAKKLPDGTWAWAGLLLEEDEYPTVEAWNKAVAQGANYEMEHRLKMKDGSYRWHLSRAYPEKDKTGTIVRWYGAATDVHSQKESEEAFRRSEEQLRIALEGAELGLFYLYPQSGKLFWSEKTKELMGLPPEAEVTQETYWLAIHPDDKDRSLAVIQEAMKAENGGSYENEFRVIGLGNGIQRWLRSKGKVNFDKEGSPFLITGVTQDITAAKESEETMELKNKELTRINNDLDNFIYTASHDLKAPINNIEGLMQVLMRNLPDETLATERVQGISQMMQESVERFKRTIASLTEVVKLQKENNSEAILINLEEVIHEVRMDLEPMVQETNAQLEVDVQSCPSIRFSHKNLRSVIYNLLSNAIKYHHSERAPRVQIHCQRTNEYDILSVKDNGLGMEEKRLGQLFGMFKRFHAHIEGTGIGLYMVKKIVDNAGGHIKVESRPGEGSTFHVFFPR